MRSHLGGEVHTEEIGAVLNISIPYLEQTRLTAYWVGNWRCTDTYVGYKLYFLDDVPVAFSSQTGRKSDEMFEWFSLAVAKNVQMYLLHLLAEESTVSVSLCDMDKDIGSGFTIAYNNGIIDTHRVFYKEKKVTILEPIINQPWGLDTQQKIQTDDGNILMVEVSELEFGYHLIPSSS